MKKNIKYLGAIPIVTLPLIAIKEYLLILFLIAATLCVSYLCSKSPIRKLGLELVTFTTVLAGILHGFVAGALVGALLILAHNMINHRFATYLIFVVPFFGVMGGLASLFASSNILILGTGLTIFSHLAFVSWRTLTARFPVRYLPYSALNIFFNFFLFKNIAPKILAISL